MKITTHSDDVIGVTGEDGSYQEYNTSDLSLRLLLPTRDVTITVNVKYGDTGWETHVQVAPDLDVKLELCTDGEETEPTKATHPLLKGSFP